jgi:hypothetical protein
LLRNYLLCALFPVIEDTGSVVELVRFFGSGVQHRAENL